MLYQFQCQKEGTLFYYQTGSRQTARAVVHRCPVCGSKRTETTGRVYPELNESTEREIRYEPTEAVPWASYRNGTLIGRDQSEQAAMLRQAAYQEHRQ